MSSDDRTYIGGGGSDFEATRWTHIGHLRGEDVEKRRTALAALCQQYWRPVYCYLRRKGHDNDRAKDITQGFFQDIVLGRDILQSADKAKGKLRTLLLTALDRYVVSLHRAATAKKRMPQAQLLSLDGMESWPSQQFADLGTPEDAFAYGWAANLLDDVLATVESDCRRRDQQLHWRVFERLVVRPSLMGGCAPALSTVCGDLGIASDVTASNMCTTVRRKFKAALRAKIRSFVPHDELIDEEINDLMQILSRRGAGK